MPSPRADKLPESGAMRAIFAVFVAVFVEPPELVLSFLLLPHAAPRSAITATTAAIRVNRTLRSAIRYLP
jgi:hypothetical protein